MVPTFDEALEPAVEALLTRFVAGRPGKSSAPFCDLFRRVRGILFNAKYLGSIWEATYAKSMKHDTKILAIEGNPPFYRCQIQGIFLCSLLEVDLE